MAKAIDIKSLLSPLFGSHKEQDPQYKPLYLSASLIKNLALTPLFDELSKSGVLLSDCFTTRKQPGESPNFCPPGIWFDDEIGYYLLFGFNRAGGDYKLPLDDDTRLIRSTDSGRFLFKIAGFAIQVGTGLTWDEEDELDDVITVSELPKRQVSQGSGDGGFAKSLCKLVLAIDGVEALNDVLDVDLTIKAEPVLGNGKYPKYATVGSAVVTMKGGMSHTIPEQKMEVTKSVALAIMQQWGGGADVELTLVPASTRDDKPYLRPL